MQVHLMPTELFVRRPLLWLQFASRGARDDPVLAELRLPALSESARRPPARRPRPVRGTHHLQWRRADQRRSLRSSSCRASRRAPAAQCDVSRVRARGSIRGRQFSAPGHAVALGLLRPSSARRRPSACPAAGRQQRCRRVDVASVRAIPNCELRLAGDADAALPDCTSDTSRSAATMSPAAISRTAEANAALYTADGWLRTGDLGVMHGRRSLHHRPRQGNHLRQRPELLPARSRRHRDPRRRARARQGGGRRRAARGCRQPTNSSCSCCTGRRSRSSCRSRRSGARAERTHRPRSRAKSCRSSAFRRPPAARSSAICSSRNSSTASSPRSSPSLRRCANCRRGRRGRGATESNAASRPSAIRR